MQVLEPIKITEEMIVASNLSEDDHPEWTSTADYKLGDYVISIATHQIYRALKDNGPGSEVVDPDAEWAAIDDVFDLTNTAPVTWDRISATNKFRLFDQSPSRITSNLAEIDITLVPGLLVNGLALFGLSATHVQITLTLSGVIQYDRTFDLSDNSEVIDWWSYYFAPIKELDELIITNLLDNSNGEFRIKIFRSNGFAACGEIVLGYLFDLGRTKSNPKIKLEDYSHIELDQYGNLTTTVRDAVQIVDYEFWISGFKTRSAFKQIKALRGAKKAVFIGDEESLLGVNTYGYVQDSEMKVSASAGLDRANTFGKIKVKGVL